TQVSTTTPSFARVLSSKPASVHSERGRSHGLPFILWLMEQSIWLILAVPTVIAAVAMLISGAGWPVFVATWFAVPLVGVILPLLFLVYRSHRHDAGAANWEEVLSFRDPKLAAKWSG